MSWVVICPTWGERCVSEFINHALPSFEAALKHAGTDALFIVPTEPAHRDRLRAALKDHPTAELPSLQRGRSAHHVLGLTHHAAMQAFATRGDMVCLTCSDMIASVECFAAARRRFDVGKKVVMVCATRTHGGEVPVGAASRELLAWTMKHPHPITTECFWGTGRSTVPWAVYFKRGDNIVLRAFHLHPFAVVKDRPIVLRGVTVDWDLVNSYTRDETHVVTDADEMAMAELSPLERMFANQPAPLTVADIARWAANHALDVHRWFFRENAITIQGENDCGDAPIAEQIINQTLKLPQRQTR